MMIECCSVNSETPAQPGEVAHLGLFMNDAGDGKTKLTSCPRLQVNKITRIHSLDDSMSYHDEDGVGAVVSSSEWCNTGQSSVPQIILPLNQLNQFGTIFARNIERFLG